MALKFETIQKSDNLVETLDEQEVNEIGQNVLKGYQIDEESRSDWFEQYKEALDIAKQVLEVKTFPWDGASNIKYPLIIQACIDFASRTMPQIIQNDRIVRCATIGLDQEGEKEKRATRVSSAMSFQCLMESSEWEVDTDKTLQVLPLVGTVFKKTYWDVSEQKNCSELCKPDEVVINYTVKSIEKAPRITHLLTLYANDIKERQRRGLFCDEDALSMPDNSVSNDGVFQRSDDEDKPFLFLEQHCWLDLDDDGYKEPYIVTVRKDNGKVARIVHRFGSVEKNSKNEIIKIEPFHYFTDFHFIHSPDGGFYSMGFGSVLLPLNKAINSLINQLIDAGTLSTCSGGLIGKGARLKTGQLQFKLGEWKICDAASGVDLKQQVFPWPVREPSPVLFQLLSLFIDIGKDLSSNTDVLQGKQPAQNVATGTVNTLLEQGSKIFSAINKRFYRSLTKEYRKLYHLNFLYLTNKKYREILDEENLDVKKDFEPKTLNVFPVADPTMSSEVQRMNRAQMVASLRSVDVREADKYFLRAIQVPEALIKTLIPDPDPNAPPPLEAQKLQAEIEKMRAQVAEISAQATLTNTQLQLEALKIQKANEEADSRINESAARIVKMSKDAQHGEAKVAIAAAKMQGNALQAGEKFVHQQQMDAVNVGIDMAKVKNDQDKNEIAAIIAAKDVSKGQDDE